MKLTILGCGDAFGSGGRFNSCYHVRPGKAPSSPCFLVDCGVSSLIALKKFDVPLKPVKTIFITHLHGDHFGGLPFVLLERKYILKDDTPLILAGPSGLEKRLKELCENLYPGVFEDEYWQAINFVTLTAGRAVSLMGLNILPFPAHHSPESQPLSLRISNDLVTLAFSGDTGWSDHLAPLSRESDLFITECSQWKAGYDMHLDYETLRENMASGTEGLTPRHTLLTHMNPDMLSHIDQIDTNLFIAAHDGMVLDIPLEAEK